PPLVPYPTLFRSHPGGAVGAQVPARDVAARAAPAAVAAHLEPLGGEAVPGDGGELAQEGGGPLVLGAAAPLEHVRVDVRGLAPLPCPVLVHRASLGQVRSSAVRSAACRERRPASASDGTASSSWVRPWVRRRARPRSMSSRRCSAFLSAAFVSRGGSWIDSSASIPAWSWRPRSSSASNSAPKSRARFMIHSHRRKMMTPARAPYVSS